MKVKVIKLSKPKPEKKHNIKVRGIYDVIPGKDTDVNLFSQHPGSVWIETEAGRVRILKDEYEEIPEEMTICKGCGEPIERFPSQKEKRYECETSGCMWYVMPDGEQDVDLPDLQEEEDKAIAQSY